MWKTRYKNKYKTSNPQLIVTAVCSFPNIIDTLDKAVESYNVKKLQKDSVLLDIMSDYYMNHGCNFIPLYFEDDIPKLAKLQKLNPISKGYFWCIGYQSPNFTEDSKSGSSSINTYPHTHYRMLLEYWLANHYTKASGITNFLFEQCVKTWVYEQSKDLPEYLKGRRFDMIANKQIRMKDNQPYVRFETTEQYISHLDDMYQTNWYEFVFKSFI